MCVCACVCVFYCELNKAKSSSNVIRPLTSNDFDSVLVSHTVLFYNKLILILKL